MKKIIFLIVITNLIRVTDLNAQEKGSFKDSRDGKTYKTIKIGKKTWFEGNLNYKTKSGSCCYMKLESNCVKYGRLYNWETAKNSCPSGWHLPDDTEWMQLAADTSAGRLLKGFAAGVKKITKQEDAIQNSWWSSTSINNEAANYWELIVDFTFRDANEMIASGFWSVRCVKD